MDILDMDCHTWALGASPYEGAIIDQRYTQLSGEIDQHYSDGENLFGKNLADVQQEILERIATLCIPRTEALDHDVYLCAGFRRSQLYPEHLWLEDHTADKTYDTFIDQRVVEVDQVGVPGLSFRPGCEESRFFANEIARMQINGYTQWQKHSLP